MTDGKKNKTKNEFRVYGVSSLAALLSFIVVVVLRVLLRGFCHFRHRHGRRTREAVGARTLAHDSGRPPVARPPPPRGGGEFKT